MALESELRKSKRAEQKLQALLFRLRQDVADAKQGADLLQRLQDQRALEYEVDFLTNKIKVRGECASVCWHVLLDAVEANHSNLCVRAVTHTMCLTGCD